MVKNIIIGLLTALCLVLVVYGMVQQTAAVKAQTEAVANAERAVKYFEEAKKQQKLAELNAEEAARQGQMAEVRMLECLKRKK